MYDIIFALSTKLSTNIEIFNKNFFLIFVNETHFLIKKKYICPLKIING
jgi:hypothetical protein